MIDVFRRWWPLVVALGASLVVQQVAYTGRYDVSGHAAEHLGSGSFVFLAGAVSFVLLWSTPDAFRRGPLVIGGVAGWLAAGVAILIGNVRVVEALIDGGQGDTPTDSLVGSARLDDAHWLADTAPLIALLAAMAIVAGLHRLGAISLRLAIVGAVLNVLIPYWILPGAGVIVVTIARCIGRERDARDLPTTEVLT
jgi:hypothetical protein